MVVDFHGWGGNAHSQETSSKFAHLADIDPDPFFVATPNGMDDEPASSLGSWNCSRTDGPLGPPCDLDRSRWGKIDCYSSCPNCDPLNSCDWTSCYDDITFVRDLVAYVGDHFCLNKKSVPFSEWIVWMEECQSCF